MSAGNIVMSVGNTMSTNNYFVCPRCGSVHDADPQPVAYYYTYDTGTEPAPTRPPTLNGRCQQCGETVDTGINCRCIRYWSTP